jgi:Flp pilus assembly protein protease CpaA
MILNYLLLPVIFLIGAITSYEDFRYGKIRNKWIVLGLAWGILIYALFLCWGILIPFIQKIYQVPLISILPSYILKVFINSFLSLCVGFSLWYFDLWSAGDAKLFAVFSLLLPLDSYWRTYLPYFPSFVLLVNIFVSATLFMVVCDFFIFFRKASSLSFNFNLKNAARDVVKNNFKVLQIALEFFLFFLFFQIGSYEISSRLNQSNWLPVAQVAAFFLLLIFFPFARKKIRKKWLISLILFATVVYLLFNYLFYSLTPLNGIVAAISNSVIVSFAFILIPFFMQKTFNENNRNLPFAVWLLTGLVITLIIKGSLVSALVNPHGFWQ